MKFYKTKSKKKIKRQWIENNKDRILRDARERYENNRDNWELLGY